MRTIFITASVILFLLSGLILYKASQIPVFSKGYTASPVVAESKVPSPESQPGLNKPDGKEDTNRDLVGEQQTTITRLEEELADSVKKPESGADTESMRKETRILAVLGSGTFKSGQVVISEKLMNVVKDIVREISASPYSRVSIEGHTDNRPIKSSAGRPYKDNMDLSFLRAKTIARMIIEQGVPSDRLSVIGYGDARPIASNETVAGRAQNRRVEVKLIPEDREI